MTDLQRRTFQFLEEHVAVPEDCPQRNGERMFMVLSIEGRIDAIRTMLLYTNEMILREMRGN